MMSKHFNHSLAALLLFTLAACVDAQCLDAIHDGTEGWLLHLTVRDLKLIHSTADSSQGDASVWHDFSSVDISANPQLPQGASPRTFGAWIYLQPAKYGQYAFALAKRLFSQFVQHDCELQRRLRPFW